MATCSVLTGSAVGERVNVYVSRQKNVRCDNSDNFWNTQVFLWETRTPIVCHKTTNRSNCDCHASCTIAHSIFSLIFDPFCRRHLGINVISPAAAAAAAAAADDKIPSEDINTMWRRLAWLVQRQRQRIRKTKDAYYRELKAKTPHFL